MIGSNYKVTTCRGGQITGTEVPNRTDPKKTWTELNRIYKLFNWVLKFYTRRTGTEPVPNREPNNTHIEPDEKPLYNYFLRNIFIVYTLFYTLTLLPFFYWSSIYSHNLDCGFWMRKSFECYFGIGFDSIICKYIRLSWVK